MHALPHTHSCFVCGDANPLGLHLRFHTDGRIVRAEFTPRPEHIGFQGVVHGGLIATLLDEIMVWACAVGAGQFAFCAELTVRYRQPLRPGVTAVATAELANNRRGRLFETRAELRDAAAGLLASATGKYLPVPPAETPVLMADLAENWPPVPRSQKPS